MRSGGLTLNVAFSFWPAFRGAEHRLPAFIKARAFYAQPPTRVNPSFDRISGILTQVTGFLRRVERLAAQTALPAFLPRLRPIFAPSAEDSQSRGDMMDRFSS